MSDDRLLKLEQSRTDSSKVMSRLLKLEESKERRMNMKLGNRFVERVEVELDVNDELAAEVLDELSSWEMAQLFNEKKMLSNDGECESTWNDGMIECLNENGRKHIKKLYDMVCKWYEHNPEDAEAEGYTEW